MIFLPILIMSISQRSTSQCWDWLWLLLYTKFSPTALNTVINFNKLLFLELYKHSMILMRIVMFFLDDYRTLIILFNLTFIFILVGLREVQYLVDFINKFRQLYLLLQFFIESLWKNLILHFIINHLDIYRILFIMLDHILRVK